MQAETREWNKVYSHPQTMTRNDPPLFRCRTKNKSASISAAEGHASMPACIPLSPLHPSPLLTKPSSARLRPPPPARSAGRRCSRWRAAGSPPGSPPRPAGCSAPAPSASSSSRSCRTARSPAPPDTSVYSGWWRGSAPRGSTRPCSSSSPSGRDWWLSWRENRRVASNNNNKESRFGVRTEVSRSPCGLQEKATVLWQRRTVRPLYAARPLTPPFSHRAPIGQRTETARAHWPISPWKGWKEWGN